MANNTKKDLLDEVIEKEIKNLNQLEPGSDNHSKAVGDVVKLYELSLNETKAEMNKEIDDRKMDMDERALDLKIEQNDIDIEMKKIQFGEDSKNKLINHAIDIGSTVLPLVCYGVWMNKGFKFEETGTFTSTTFRGLFNKFRPTK